MTAYKSKLQEYKRNIMQRHSVSVIQNMREKRGEGRERERGGERERD